METMPWQICVLKYETTAGNCLKMGGVLSTSFPGSSLFLRKKREEPGNEVGCFMRIEDQGCQFGFKRAKFLDFGFF